MSEIELTENDERFEHIVFDHLLLAYKEIIIAATEAATGPEEDSRFGELTLLLDATLRSFDKLINDQIDLIPGSMSLEEANHAVNKIFENAALLNGLPADSYLPPKQILQ